MTEKKTPQPRYSMNYTPGIVPGKPWAVRDHVLGRAAQTDGLQGPLAYFATEDEARTWTADMNARHFAGTAPAYEVETYRGGSAVGEAEHVAWNTPLDPALGDVKFVRPAEL
ncbi:hypothetical protein MUK60_07610 [Streptomyces sp. LRE541]|uniref:hypothetical protein n=1 Tax=Streptomyces sp. LRE541 TaxID=2931983 RepID=UPI00200EE222|nr:hypothetical protein [Streptomyces sp. LRE541]UPZ27700.1 hypothetical protein MUK60_07610 [Streptomyces sp. LRE541]